MREKKNYPKLTRTEKPPRRRPLVVLVAPTKKNQERKATATSSLQLSYSFILARPSLTSSLACSKTVKVVPAALVVEEEASCSFSDFQPVILAKAAGERSRRVSRSSSLREGVDNGKESQISSERIETRRARRDDEPDDLVSVGSRGREQEEKVSSFE